MKEYTDKELTKIYKDANDIGDGKNPQISTAQIFAAMRYIANLEDSTQKQYVEAIQDTNKIEV